MDRYKTLLPSDKNKNANNSDLFVSFKLDNSNVLNGYDNIISILDVEEQFNKERQKSDLYRISGKINFLHADADDLKSFSLTKQYDEKLKLDVNSTNVWGITNWKSIQYNINDEYSCPVPNNNVTMKYWDVNPLDGFFPIINSTQIGLDNGIQILPTNNQSVDTLRFKWLGDTGTYNITFNLIIESRGRVTGKGKKTGGTLYIDLREYNSTFIDQYEVEIIERNPQTLPIQYTDTYIVNDDITLEKNKEYQFLTQYYEDSTYVNCYGTDFNLAQQYDPLTETFSGQSYPSSAINWDSGLNLFVLDQYQGKESFISISSKNSIQNPNIINTNWFGFKPTKNDFSFLPQDKNWLLQLTIPNGIIENYPLQGNSIPIDRGFRYILTGFTYNNKNTIALKTELINNIDVGDYVYCEHIEFPNLVGREEINGIHRVIYKGNPINGEDSDTILVLDLNNSLDLIPFANKYGIIKKITSPSLNDQLKTNYLTTIERLYLNQNNKQCIEFNQEHNLIDGDFISLKGYLLPNISPTFTGIHRIKYIDDFNVELYYNFQNNQNNTLVSIFPELKWKRLDGCPSQYFMRSFEIITSNYIDITLPKRDYDLYQSGYEVDIFNREKYLFNFKEIDISEHKDYLGRNISDIYLTFIKRPGESPKNFTSTDVFFYDYSLKSGGSGLKLKWVDNNNELVTNYNSNSENINTNKIKNKGDKYFGDIVEYLVSNLEENIIIEPIFRFNTKERDDNLETNGFIYKPHHRIPIRKFSTSIEQFDFSDVAEFPNYAESYKGKFLWRDLLDKGFIEDTVNGVDYPFLNNNHYIFNVFNLTLKPQNPELIDGFIINEDIVNNFENEC